MKKINIILIVILIILIIMVFFVMKLLENNEIKEDVQTSTATQEQRILWNRFLIENPYLSQIDDITIQHMMMSSTDLLKIALTTDKIPTERIVAEEIKQNQLLTEGDGYKKSKIAIDEYLKQLLGLEDIRYNFIDTFVEGGNYIIIGEDYVYFTKIKLPEKIYIATSYTLEETTYEVKIYEYDVTEETREKLNQMLETGNIDTSIETANKYTLKGEIVDDNIRIDYKTPL